jgi:hypothetical protein
VALMLVNAVWIVIAFGIAYWIPGRLLVDLLIRDALPEERLPFALVLGLAVVNVVAILVVGMAGLMGPVYLTPGVMWLIVSAVLAILAALRLWRRGLNFQDWIARPTRTQVFLWVATALATTFFLVHYDDDLLWEESCMVRAATAICADTLDPDLLEAHVDGGKLSSYQSDPLLGRYEQRNNFLVYNQGEPLGPSILIAPFLALFGLFGFRLVYVLQGLLLPAGGFLLGRRLTGKSWAGWVTAALLTFSPYALEVRTFDENFIASAFGTVALVMLTRPGIPFYAAGIATAMLVGLRQPIVIMVPFLLIYLRRASHGEPGARSRFLGAMALIGLPILLKHMLFTMTAGGTLFEGAFERPLAPHSLFGHHFDLRVLLSFPFVSEPLRSPYNAYPTLVAYPLDVLRHFGFLAAALAPAGLVWLWRGHRRTLGLFAAWVVPLFALLMVQSNWIEPNKMGVPATVLAPLVVVVICGLMLLADSSVVWWKRLVPVVIGLVLPLAFTYAVRDYRAPKDPRVFGYPLELYDKIFSPGTVRFLDESPEFVEWDRQRIQPGLLPDWPLESFHPVVLGRSVSSLAHAVGNPRFRDYIRPMPDRLMQVVLGKGMVVGPLTLLRMLDGGERDRGKVFRDPEADTGMSVGVTLDLSAPFLGESPLILAQEDRPGESVRAAGDASPVLDAVAGGPTIVTGVRLPWSETLSSLLVARDHTGAVFMFLMPGSPPDGEEPGFGEARFLDAAAFPGNRFHLNVPQGELVRLIDIRSVRPARWYIRLAVVRADGIVLFPPRAISPT